MNGSVFILNENVLYCSNDADLTMNSLINRDEAGKIISSDRTQVINVMNYMVVNGELAKNDNVHCQFKFDDNNNVESFSAIVSFITKESITLNLKARSMHSIELLETIKSKIKGGN